MPPTDRDLPDSDPHGPDRGRVQQVLEEEFRRVLLFEDREVLDPHANYFDLGMSSLRLMDAKTRAEERLGLPIETAHLFSAVTVAELADLIRPPEPGPRSAGDRDAAPSTYDALSADVLAELYE